MRIIIKTCTVVALLILPNFAFPVFAQDSSIHQKVTSLLEKMTLEEKVGQLNQYTSDWDFTGPITADGDKEKQIKVGIIVIINSPRSGN